jgi:hypothetical protein
MVKLGKAKLLETFEDALADSGWNALAMSGVGRGGDTGPSQGRAA